MIQSIGRTNPLDPDLTDLLQGNNVIAPSDSEEDCDYLLTAVTSWLKTSADSHHPFLAKVGSDGENHVLWAQLLPVRCDWQRRDGVITFCPESFGEDGPCSFWNETRPANPRLATRSYYADVLGVRTGEIVLFERWDAANSSQVDTGKAFYVKTIFNESHSVGLA